MEINEEKAPGLRSCGDLLAELLVCPEMVTFNMKRLLPTTAADKTLSLSGSCEIRAGNIKLVILADGIFSHS